MIRRPFISHDNIPCWVLISQIEHARLAGEMAAAWGSQDGQFHSLSSIAGLVQAICHHDDGWAEWEKRPSVDPLSGKPRDFLEMPLDEALVIWRKSIDATIGLGSLQGYVVSRHFSVLLGRSANSWSVASAPGHGAATEFLQQQTAIQEELLAAWRQQDSIHNTLQAANLALSWLQFFDGLSLWLCCRERTENHVAQPPGQPAIELRPGLGGEIEVDPWPFGPAELRLETIGRLVPAISYASSDDLAAVPTVVHQLDWRLLPAKPQNRAAIS